MEFDKIIELNKIKVLKKRIINLNEEKLEYLVNIENFIISLLETKQATFDNYLNIDLKKFELTEKKFYDESDEISISLLKLFLINPSIPDNNKIDLYSSFFYHFAINNNKEQKLSLFLSIVSKYLILKDYENYKNIITTTKDLMNKIEKELFSTLEKFVEKKVYLEDINKNLSSFQSKMIELFIIFNIENSKKIYENNKDVSIELFKRLATNFYNYISQKLNVSTEDNLLLNRFLEIKTYALNNNYRHIPLNCLNYLLYKNFDSTFNENNLDNKYLTNNFDLQYRFDNLIKGFLELKLSHIDEIEDTEQRNSTIQIINTMLFTHYDVLLDINYGDIKILEDTYLIDDEILFKIISNESLFKFNNENNNKVMSLMNVLLENKQRINLFPLNDSIFTFYEGKNSILKTISLINNDVEHDILSLFKNSEWNKINKNNVDNHLSIQSKFNTDIILQKPTKYAKKEDIKEITDLIINIPNSAISVLDLFRFNINVLNNPILFENVILNNSVNQDLNLVKFRKNLINSFELILKTNSFIQILPFLKKQDLFNFNYSDYELYGDISEQSKIKHLTLIKEIKDKINFEVLKIDIEKPETILNGMNVLFEYPFEIKKDIENTMYKNRFTKDFIPKFDIEGKNIKFDNKTNQYIENIQKIFKDIVSMEDFFSSTHITNEEKIEMVTELVKAIKEKNKINLSF